MLPTYFKVLLILPLRGVQLARFDSGEGDFDRFNGSDLKWEENTSLAAGYWKEDDSRPFNRGFAKMVGEQSQQVTGIFVNTNKTGQPYIVPWEHPKIHKLLWDLRVWQEEHFPVNRPLEPHEYSKGDGIEDEDKLSRLPSIFVLFRLPGGRRGHVPGAPPSWRRRDQAWQELMLEVEQRWNQRNPLRLIQIVKRQPKTGQAQGALYNLHGLRVAGLTRLLMSGVPLEILSKLVAGHAALVMTIYYLKFRPVDIHNILQEAAKTAPALSEEFIDGFHHWSLDQAKKHAVSLNPAAVEAAWDQEPAHKQMLSDVTIGMCPNAATQCDTGGDPIPGTKDGRGRYRYGPVEGGTKNCIMCRHFISGPPYMLQLWLFGTSLLDRYDQTMQMIEELQAKKNEMFAHEPEGDERGRVKRQIQIATLDIQIDAQTTAALLLLKGVHRTWSLLEMSETIRKLGKDGAGVDLIVQDASTVVELAEFSQFERDIMLVAGSRIFPMIRNEATERRLELSMTKIHWESGLQPIAFSSLTPEQKRYSTDQAAQLILSKLDQHEVRNLAEGRITLRDVGLVPEMERIPELALSAPHFSSAIEHVPLPATKAPRHGSRKK